MLSVGYPAAVHRECGEAALLRVASMASDFLLQPKQEAGGSNPWGRPSSSPHTSSPSYCRRVQIPDKSSHLGLIHEMPLGRGRWWRWRICGNTDSSFNLGYSYFTYTPASWTTLAHRHLWLRYTSESMTPLTQWNHWRNGKPELVTPLTK